MGKLMTIGLVSAFAVASQAGLVHRYDFETDGVVNDTVGTADGTLHGTATVAGGALVTDGSAAGLVAGVAQNGAMLPTTATDGITGSFSVEIWYTVGNSGLWKTDFSFSDGTTDNYVLSTPVAGFSPYPNRVEFIGAGGSATAESVHGIYLDQGGPHQKVLTYDAGTGLVSLFIDGALANFSGLQAQFNNPGVDLSSLDYIGIFGGAPYPDGSPDGSAFDFRIYDDDIWAGQVSALYGLGSDATNVAINAAIPEPATFGLLGIFGAGLLFVRRRFRI